MIPIEVQGQEKSLHGQPPIALTPSDATEKAALHIASV